MAEVTFVGLAVFVWMGSICLLMGTIGCIVLIAHVVNIEVRHFVRQRRTRLAQKEMLERQARLRRQKEQQAKDAQFFATIEGISNEL